MKRLVWAAVFGLFCASNAHAAPDCLILQLQVPIDDVDTNLLLAPYVAEELDKDGRLRPVVWSLTDPVFREWTSKDVFGAYEAHPSASMAQDTARRLGVQYVLLVQAYRQGQDFVPVGELFVNGRSAWRFGPRRPNKANDIVIQAGGRYDEKATRQLQQMLPQLLRQGGSFTVFTAGGPDFGQTARSVASTWTALLSDGPLKGLPPKPRITDGRTESGSKPGPADVTGPVGAGDDDVAAQAKNLVANGQTQRALLLLRAACDLRPFDMVIRRQLVETLLASGMPSEAASAAQATANLKPSDPSLWVLAAKAWIGASDQDKAQEALNEALARGATGPDVEETKGDLALLKGDANEAMAVYQTLEPGRATLRRAVAIALTGDSEGSLKVLAALNGRALTADEYGMVVLFVERALLTLTDSARNVLPAIRLHPGEPATMTAAGSANRTAVALSTLLANLTPPVVHKDSHEARKLAHILLSQATLEALEFAKTNDPDLGEEAAATLGQALKIFPGVREKFGLERKYGSA